VRETIEGESQVPGNMFVPIDLLKPILADLIEKGRRSGPARRRTVSWPPARRGRSGWSRSRTPTP